MTIRITHDIEGWEGGFLMILDEGMWRNELWAVRIASMYFFRYLSSGNKKSTHLPVTQVRLPGNTSQIHFVEAPFGFVVELDFEE
jgi:hypothetical protein